MAKGRRGGLRRALDLVIAAKRKAGGVLWRTLHDIESRLTRCVKKSLKPVNRKKTKKRGKRKSS